MVSCTWRAATGNCCASVHRRDGGAARTLTAVAGGAAPATFRTWHRRCCIMGIPPETE